MREEIIYGLHPVKVILQKQAWRIKKIAVLQDRLDKRMQEILNIAKKNHVTVEQFSHKALDKITLENHQGVIAFCQASKILDENDLIEILNQLKKPAFLLVLDEVQDPHNLGACMRSANAVGVDAVIVPKRHSVGITSVVRKVASGAVDHTPFVQVGNLARTLELLRNQYVYLYGLSEHATKSVFDANFKQSVALVLGAEGYGLRHLTQQTCDELLAIPMTGVVESLNVSVAAGVCLFEVVRQRL